MPEHQEWDKERAVFCAGCKTIEDEFIDQSVLWKAELRKEDDDRENRF
jgi:hypothetical protein